MTIGLLNVKKILILKKYTALEEKNDE